MDSFVHCQYGFIKKHSWNLALRFFLECACGLDQFRLTPSQERINPIFDDSLVEFRRTIMANLGSRDGHAFS
jgi:hypothetical protein